MLNTNMSLDLARNIFGKLDKQIRNRIEKYICCPNSENWEDIKSIILNDDFMTVWQAVIIIDPKFPKVGRMTNFHGRVLKD